MPALPSASSLACLSQLQSPDRVQVDPTFPGAIRNVSILTTGPAKGHGFAVDSEAIDQATQLSEGVYGRWTHGGGEFDALGRHLGRWTNLRRQDFRICRPCGSETETAFCGSCGQATEGASRALGDFVFSESAWALKPDGLDVPAPRYLMTRADEDPRSLGVSIVAQFRLSEGEQGRVGRIGPEGVLRADWVADPAANPTGLSDAAESSLTTVNPIVARLDQLVAKRGEGVARMEAFAFLARYFGDSPEEPPAQPAAPAVSPPLPSSTIDVTQLSEIKAELNQLRAEVAQGRTSIAASLRDDLKRESTALGAPISGGDLSAVDLLVTSGAAGPARLLANSLLETAKAKAQVQHEATELSALTAPAPAPDPERIRAAQAEVLRLSGLSFSAPLLPQGPPPHPSLPPLPSSSLPA